MSEISETQRNLNKLMNDYEAAVIGENRGRNLSGYSEKVDKYYQKRRELKEFVAELEAEIAETRCDEIDALNARIAELEGDNKKAFDLVRKLRMYCIWANWDNPDTEDEFNEFDVEVCKWLSKFMECEE